MCVLPPRSGLLLTKKQKNRIGNIFLFSLCLSVLQSKFLQPQMKFHLFQLQILSAQAGASSAYSRASHYQPEGLELDTSVHTSTQVRVLLPKQRIIPPTRGLLLAKPKLGPHQPNRGLLQSTLFSLRWNSICSIDRFFVPKQGLLLPSLGLHIIILRD